MNVIRCSNNWWSSFICRFKKTCMHLHAKNIVIAILLPALTFTKVNIYLFLNVYWQNIFILQWDLYLMNRQIYFQTPVYIYGTLIGLCFILIIIQSSNKCLVARCCLHSYKFSSYLVLLCSHHFSNHPPQQFVLFTWYYTVSVSSTTTSSSVSVLPAVFFYTEVFRIAEQMFDRNINILVELC